MILGVPLRIARNGPPAPQLTEDGLCSGRVHDLAVSPNRQVPELAASCPAETILRDAPGLGRWHPVKRDAHPGDAFIAPARRVVWIDRTPCGQRPATDGPIRLRAGVRHPGAIPDAAGPDIPGEAEVFRQACMIVMHADPGLRRTPGRQSGQWPLHLHGARRRGDRRHACQHALSSARDPRHRPHRPEHHALSDRRERHRRLQGRSDGGRRVPGGDPARVGAICVTQASDRT